MATRSIVVRLRAEISGYRQSMNDAARATRRVGDDAARSESAMGRMAQSAQRNQQSWQQAGAAMTGFGVIVLGALGLSAKAAIEWETAWTGVLKTVEGSPQQLAALEGELRALARALPVSHVELAAVAEAAGQLGVKRADIAGFTKTMIDLGKTTNLTSDEAATSIAQLMNVMQTAPEDVDNLGAALVELGNNGASTERDIVQMAQRISGAGQIIGLTEADVLGIANAVSSVGIEVEAGGSAISRILIDMSKSVKQGGADLDGFAKAAGMSSSEFVTAFESDPASAFASFTEGLGRIDAAGGDVFTTLSDLGQSDIRVSRALLTMATSGTLLRDSIVMGNEAWEANTALLEEAEKRYATTESQIQSAKGSINDAAITLGQVFLPMIAGAANGVAKLADAFGSMPPFIQAVIGGLGLAIGTVALLGGAFLLLMPRIVATRIAFGVLAADAGRATAAMRYLAAASTIFAPWGAIFFAAAAGVGLLVEKVLLTGQVVPKMNALKVAIEGVANSGDKIDDLGGQFSNFGTVLGLNVNSTKSLTEAFDQMLSPSTTDRMSGFFDGIPGVTGYMERLEERVGGVDTALTAMISEGDIDSVNEFQAGLMEAGYSAEEINKLLPNTADALVGVDEAAKDTAEAMVVLADGTTVSAEEAEAAAEAYQKWVDTLVETSRSFIDFGGAYDDLVQAQIDSATALAASTDSADDSWQNFYDGQTISIDAYIAKLTEQVTAQANWGANMLIIAGQVSQETFDKLNELGPEYADLMAQLAVDPEALKDIDGLYNAALVNGNAYAAGIADIYPPEVPISTAEAEAKTDGLTANIEAQGLGLSMWELDADPSPAVGEAGWLQSELDRYSVSQGPWAIDADTDPAIGSAGWLQSQLDSKGRSVLDWAIDADTVLALTKADGAVTTINGKSASIDVSANTANATAITEGWMRLFGGKSISVGVTARPAGGVGAAQAKATGGAITGPGTGTSDSVPILASNGEHMITAAEVQAAGGHGAIYDIRAALRSRRKFATGGEITASGARSYSNINPQPMRSSSQSITVSAPSLEGMVLTGTLAMRSDGLVDLIDGRIVSASTARSGAMRGGPR